MGLLIAKLVTEVMNRNDYVGRKSACRLETGNNEFSRTDLSHM